MKYAFLLVVSLSFSFIGNAASRSAGLEQMQQQPQIVYVPIPLNTQTGNPEEIDPIEADKQLDKQLFNHFISILGNFGKIILNPNDTQNATTHAAHMIDGIIAVAQTLTRTYRSPVGLDRIIAAFIRYIQQHHHGPRYISKQQICDRS
jgi:hypothetical protein